MSKMSDLATEISDLLENGYDASEIALMLEIPQSWVFEYIDMENDYVQWYLNFSFTERCHWLRLFHVAANVWR